MPISENVVDALTKMVIRARAVRIAGSNTATGVPDDETHLMKGDILELQDIKKEKKRETHLENTLYSSPFERHRVAW